MKWFKIENKTDAAIKFVTEFDWRMNCIGVENDWYFLDVAQTKIRYFTFGSTHQLDGVAFNSQTIIRIEHPEPRQLMSRLFGGKWSFEYPEITDEPRTTPLALNLRYWRGINTRIYDILSGEWLTPDQIAKLITDRN